MSTPAAQPAPGQEHKNYLTKTAPLNRMTVTRGASVLDIEYHHQGAAPHRTFRLPARSTWSPGPHWHEATDEFFKVVQGSVRLVVGGRSRVLTAKDGEIKVNKGVIHDFMRADTGADKAGEEVVLEERCEPEDGTKEIFLRNILSLGQEKDEIFSPFMKFLNIPMISQRYDNYDVYLPAPGTKLLTYLIYFICSFIGWIFNLRFWYPDYLPVRCWDVAGGKYRRPIKGE